MRWEAAACVFLPVLAQTGGAASADDVRTLVLVQTGDAASADDVRTLVLVQTGDAASADDVRTLVLAHPLGAGETAWIGVQVGAIGRGREIDHRLWPGARRHFAVRRAHRAGRRNLYAARPGGCDPRRTHRRPPDDHARRCAAAPAHGKGSAQREESWKGSSGRKPSTSCGGHCPTDE